MTEELETLVQCPWCRGRHSWSGYRDDMASHGRYVCTHCPDGGKVAALAAAFALIVGTPGKWRAYDAVSVAERS